MDFHSLARKQLQALCKKNKIPANLTNVAMADSLAALQHVEGMEELCNPSEAEATIGTPACRTSTRRKPVTEEPESTKILTRPRRVTRARNDEGVDEENKDVHVPPVTPAGPTTRRRAPNSRMKATTSCYNTRKSTRLLEKGLSKMSLLDKEMSSVSQKMEGLEDTENVDSSLTESSDVIEESCEIESVKVDEIPQKIDGSENAVEEGSSSMVISTEVEEETDETESVKAMEQTGEAESVKVDEISEEMIEEEEEEEGASSQIFSTEVISSDKNTEFECQSKDSNSDMSLASEEESDPGARPQVEAQESLIKVNESGTPLKDVKNSTESEIEITKSIAKEVNDANNESGAGIIICQIENDAFSNDKQKSNEHKNMGNGDENSVLMFSSHAENETFVEKEDDIACFAEILDSEVNDEVDASIVVEDQNEAIEHSNVDKEAVETDLFSAQKIEAFEGACDIEEVMFSTENKTIETAYDNQNFEEMLSAENTVVETSCDIQNPEEMFSTQKKEVEFEASSVIEENANVTNGISSEQKTPEVPLQFSCQDALKDNASVEVKSVIKMCDEEEGHKQKEDLESKSLRQLKKMLKNLTLDNKTSNDKISDSGVKDVERKRTALQQLPENQMVSHYEGGIARNV